ncbi:MAG: tape measure protein [Pseudomonas sp.]
MAGEKTIATLVGKLKFAVDSSGLFRFEKMLDSIYSKMGKLEQRAKTLQNKLSLSPSVKGAAAAQAARTKASEQTRNALNRERRLELSLSNAKRAAFTAELNAQKLLYTGQRQQAQLQTAQLKAKQQQAVLDAKAYSVLQQRLKTEGHQIKNAGSLAAAQLREKRLAALLLQQQFKTLQAQQRQLAGMTALQRAEVRLNQIRAEGARKARADGERRAQQQRTLAQREARAAEDAARRRTAAQRSDERHRWAQERQARADADRSRRGGGGGGRNSRFGVGGGFDVVGLARANPVVAAVAALVGVVTLLDKRIQASGERVSDAEQYENIFVQAGGANVENQKHIRKQFESIANKYGTGVDMETAKDFRTQIMMRMGQGKTLDQAIELFEKQSAAFRGAGMNKSEMQRANIQLKQVSAKGRGDMEDYKTFLEAAPLLGSAIGKAWAERTEFKGPANKIQGGVMEDIPKGGLLAEDFTKGIELFVSANQATIDKQSQSIQSSLQRRDNEQFLTKQVADQSPALIAAIKERVQAERELNTAMTPVTEAMVKFDTALNRAKTSLINFYFQPRSNEEHATRLKEAKEKVASLSKYSDNHPSKRIAQNNLRKVQREIVDSLMPNKALKWDTLPDYLKNLKNGRAKPAATGLNTGGMPALASFMERMQQPLQPMADNRMNLMGTALAATQSRTPALQPPSNISNVDNRSVTISKIEVVGSSLTVEEIASELESKIQGIARSAFSDGLSSTLGTARTNLVETRK